MATGATAIAPMLGLAPAMFDRKSPLSLLVEAEMKKDGVMRDLRRMAMKLSMSREEQDGKDLLAKSLARVIDPDDDPWRPGTHSFLAHMHGVMRQVRYRQRRKLSGEAEVSDGGLAQENAANDDPRADDVLERGRSLEVMRRLGERVLDRLGSDLLARQLYEIAMKEDLDPSEEEVRLNKTAAEIQAARKRLKYHGRIVLEEWNASEERRMKLTRERTRTKSEEGTP
jgi:hypothetical protein